MVYAGPTEAGGVAAESHGREVFRVHNQEDTRFSVSWSPEVDKAVTCLMTGCFHTVGL